MSNFLNYSDCKTWTEFMGEGYGQAVFNARKARVVEQTLERLGGDMELSYESYWHAEYYDCEDNNYGSGSTWKNTTLKKVLEDMAEYVHYDYNSREDRVSDFSGIKDLNDVSEMFCEFFCGDDGGVGPLLTHDQVNKENLDRRRKKLEQAAAKFAAKCGHKVGTREYIIAARKAIRNVRNQRNRWNDGEIRMEEWAACQFAGVGSSVYFDDLNFENSRYDNRLDSLREVLDWLEEACPLLMCQMEQEDAFSETDDEDEDY